MGELYRIHRAAALRAAAHQIHDVIELKGLLLSLADELENSPHASPELLAQVQAAVERYRLAGPSSSCAL